MIKTIVIAIILVAIIMLALGVKLLFDKDAEFSAHSCSFTDGGQDSDGNCSSCELNDLTDCSHIESP